jgi:hypothetical protein
LKYLWLDNFHRTLPDAELGQAVFLYAFTVAFTVVFILVFILVGRYEKEDATERYAAGQRLRFGITAWAGKALRRAGTVLVLSGIIYFCAMLILSMENLFHLLKIAFGASVASFLWFGGIEAINHVLLKLTLSARGIAPRHYEGWIEANKRMALIRPKGYKMAFYHHTLTNYYKNQRLENNPRIRVKKNVWKDTFAYSIIMAFFFLMLFLPFAMRYWWNVYWPDPYQFNVSQEDIDRARWHKLEKGTYQVQQPGTVILRAHGFIQVGTFVGLVLSPAGTREGYMGMPLKNSYNLPQTADYAHAALLVRQRRGSGKAWSTYQYVRTEARDSLTLRVATGDQVQFIVNDKEYQNNLRKYTVTIEYIAQGKE